MSATTQQTWTLVVYNPETDPETFSNLTLDEAKAKYRDLLESDDVQPEAITGNDWPLDWENWRDNGCCPHCGVYGIDGDNLGVHGLAIEQAFTCPLCDYSWQDNYEIVSHNDDTNLYPVVKANQFTKELKQSLCLFVESFEGTPAEDRFTGFYDMLDLLRQVEVSN